MKKKLFSIFSALLIAILLTSTAGAGGVIKLGAVNFSLGSLIAEGYVSVTGFGKIDVTVVLDASGTPAITCTNNGSNDVPGQSFPKVTASGKQTLLGDKTVWKNGKSPFGVETVDPTTVAWDVGGCPNPNWIARIDFIFWEHATISVYDADAPTGEPLLQQSYDCTTDRELASVMCTPTN